MRLALLIFAAVVLGCSGGRPEEEQARTQFSARYPEAEIVSVRMTEDEVVARSFTFEYRKRGRPDVRTIALQWVEAGRGRYEPSPAFPESLP
jgi:hypothetical protein